MVAKIAPHRGAAEVDALNGSYSLEKRVATLAQEIFAHALLIVASLPLLIPQAILFLSGSNRNLYQEAAELFGSTLYSNLPRDKEVPSPRAEESAPLPHKEIKKDPSLRLAEFETRLRDTDSRCLQDDLREAAAFLQKLDKDIFLSPFMKVYQWLTTSDPAADWKKLPITPEIQTHFEKLPEDTQEILYKLAFEVSNIYLQKPAASLPDPSSYSVNILWINRKTVPPTEKTLFTSTPDTSGKLETFEERLITPLKEWAEKNPGTPVNLWYDSDLVSEPTLEGSLEALREAVSDEVFKQIHFKSIRSIEHVKDTPRFYTEKVPLYFRVDMLKLILLLHETKEGRTALQVDADITPMSRAQIFDAKTTEDLSRSGFLLAKHGLNYENSLHLLSSTNMKAQDIVKERLFESPVSVYNTFRRASELEVSDDEVVRGKADQHFFDYVCPDILNASLRLTSDFRGALRSGAGLKPSEAPPSRFGHAPG